MTASDGVQNLAASQEDQGLGGDIDRFDQRRGTALMAGGQGRSVDHHCDAALQLSIMIVSPETVPDFRLAGH